MCYALGNCGPNFRLNRPMAAENELARDDRYASSSSGRRVVGSGRRVRRPPQSGSIEGFRGPPRTPTHTHTHTIHATSHPRGQIIKCRRSCACSHKITIFDRFWPFLADFGHFGQFCPKSMSHDDSFFENSEKGVCRAIFPVFPSNCTFSCATFGTSFMSIRSIFAELFKFCHVIYVPPDPTPDPPDTTGGSPPHPYISTNFVGT